MGDIFEYRVHPSVGIARMGNSATTYFLTAEKPMYFSHDGGKTKTQAFAAEQKVIPTKADRRIAGHSGIRDADGNLCKQGAKFRVFCYQYEEVAGFMPGVKVRGGLKDLWECTEDRYDISWTVQVANRKSTLGGDWTDPREANLPVAVTVSKADAGVLKPFTGVPAGRLPLGSCFTDSAGNLTVLGSDGKVQRMPGAKASHAVATPQRLYWAGYEDDAADGFVKALVTPKPVMIFPDATLPTQIAEPAWVIVGLPDYAPDIRPGTTLYDVALNHAYDMAKRAKTGVPDVKPLITYYQLIRQMLYAQFAVHYTYTPHRLRVPFNIPGYSATNALFNLFMRPAKKTDKLRPESIWAAYTTGGGLHVAPAQQLPAPDYEALGTGGGAGGLNTMPDLEFTSITQLQQMAISNWAAGTLEMGSFIPETATAQNLKPYQLDRAHLESMSGGSFFPGIEVGRTAFWPQTWKGLSGCCPQHFDTRIARQVADDGTSTTPPAPGYLTKDLACPWQADFYACDATFWPHSRPDIVQLGLNAPGGWKQWATGGGLNLGSHAETSGGVTFVPLADHYWKLGFVQYQDDAAGGQMVEKGRAAGFAPTTV